MANPVLMKPVSAMPQMARVTRNPQHTFYTATAAWQITPFMIAPVLPGETLQNLLLQARVVSDPIKNPLIGWWAETYFYYVKLTDLDAREEIVNMLVTGAALPFNDATNVWGYHTNDTTAPSVDWAKRCLERVVACWFRGEGEGVYDYVSEFSQPVASINRDSWTDSLLSLAQWETAQDENLASATPGQGDGTTGVYVSEIEQAMRRYEMARHLGVTDMTFEDYLASFGVTVPSNEKTHVPELIRYTRNWSYPTNTVNPANGTPSTAMSWSLQERADKKRFFKEPGFIFGVSVFRPKVYLGNQKDAAVNMMNDAMSWLPAQFRDDMSASFKELAAGSSPLTNASGAYVVDLKDLLIYGDQYLTNTTATDRSLVALPTAALQKRYASAADASSLFVSDTADAIKMDGVVNLKISGHQVDTSPNFVGNQGFA